MGSCMSMIYDDMDAYEHLCNSVGVKSRSMEEMFKHEEEIMKKHNLERTYFGYQVKQEIVEKSERISTPFPENLYWD